MIISDLEFIESADNSEVQGGGGYKGYKKPYYPKYKKTSANAFADAGAAAFGDKTNAFAFTSVVADADAGVAIADSVSSASAKSYKPYYKKY
ncbi:MAG: hypothetical protein WBM86_28715 [Waterburya sp.]